MKSAKYLTDGRNGFTEPRFSEQQSRCAETWEITRFRAKPHGTEKSIGVTCEQDITPAILNGFDGNRYFYDTAKRIRRKREAVVANFATTAADGKTYQVDYYNLDVIISVGYRVKSQRGVQFRIWATGILKEYMRKGFALDDERLKNLGGGGYFKELLERIRDIRASEKVFYRQVLEIYATSIDYDPRAEISIQFFKKVQNKIHYAIHGQTAAEAIYTRADAEKEFMGLTTFSGSQTTLKEAVVAKKYLISEVELFPREEQKTQKRFVKAIAYKFPIEQKVLTQFDECGASIETVVLLSKDML